MQVARYYCRAGHRTFSLLPDCLASRLSSTLAEVEQVVIVAEAAPTLEQAAAELRPDIERQGAMRWLRRRLGPVQVALLAIVTLLPWAIEPAGRPTLAQARSALGRPTLARLREIAGAQLGSLPPPLGLGRRSRPRRSRQDRFQHEAGADPPGDRR
jgi:hypothetical protein